MPLKDKWVDKNNGVDDVLAEDINDIAHAVIDLEKGGGGSALPEVTATDNGKFLRVVDGAWAAVAIPKYYGEYEVVT